MTALRLPVVLAAAALGCTAAATADPVCPPPSTRMALLKNMPPPHAEPQQVLVCEDFSTLNGSLTFLAVDRLTGAAGATIARLEKRLYAQTTQPTFAGLNMSAASRALDDAIGKALLRAAAADGNRSVSYDEVLAALPPIISGWGDKPNFGYAGQHTFTGSRQASVDLVFDHKGDCGQWTGFPRPLTVIPDKLDPQDVSEGLLGGELPILVWSFGVLVPDGADGSAGSAACRWEMTVAPVADVGGNHEQPAFFRFIKLCGAAASGAPLYFDTNIYTPDYSPPAEDYYATILGQRQYWDDTWEREGLVGLQLPGQDGALLVDQLRHSLLRDMITRVDTFFPRYGICGGAGGCAYGGPHNNGFQEIFTASLSGSLELGAFEYAGGVLRNYLEYYLKERGTIAYRGLEMAESGRMLSLFAQYWRYTRDAEPLLKHFRKIQGIVVLLTGRRDRALAAFPATTDPRHGMAAGHDEADLFVTWANNYVSGNHTTELPFYSISAEFYRGLVDLGAAWEEIGRLHSNKTVAAAGSAMAAAAPPLLADLRASMAASHKLAVGLGADTCWPYVAGTASCSELDPQASIRDSEPWRTYAEMAWSGALEPAVLADVIEQSRNHNKSMRLGMLSGTGSDCCVSSKALSFCCASTVFLSKTVPFRVVPRSFR
eukprot:SAG22_NODE_525_length_9470_cov_21.475936_1_plen_658_part_00